ncbi:MAG: hypothetical protein WBG48_13630, partial [Pricia sp.]
MLPKNPRHLVYALVLLIFSAIGTTAIANNKVRSIFTEVTSVLRDVAVGEKAEAAVAAKSETKTASVSNTESADVASAPMFMTIVQGADEEVNCSVNG